MHDPQYRAEVARQNTVYNQPSYPSFYFASDMDLANVPIPNIWTPKDNLKNNIEFFSPEVR
jgi:hypothetical protein